VDVLSVSGILNAVSEDGAVEDAEVLAEVLEGLPKKEFDAGGPNMFAGVVAEGVEFEVSDAFEEPKRLLENLEPEPKTEPEETFESAIEDFVPKPQKSDDVSGSETDGLAFSDGSSYSFCIRDRCVL
jgi:translation elongation factor EF-Tu-like GTPase